MAVDLRQPQELEAVLRRGSLVINSTSHHFNLPVMHAALAAKVHYMDLGGLFHFTRRQLHLHSYFKERGILAVLGMGCAPGISNLMAREMTREWDEVESVQIKVAGIGGNSGALPYSRQTLLEEFTLRPAVFKNGRWVFCAPKSGAEWWDFSQPVGRQRVFRTLHSEVATLPLFFRDRGIQNVSFKIALSESLESKVIGRKTRDSTLQELGAEFSDTEILAVSADGRIGSQWVNTWIEFEAEGREGWRAGDLNTACPASIAAGMILDGTIDATGVFAPEDVVPWNPMEQALTKRGFWFWERVSLMRPESFLCA